MAPHFTLLNMFMTYYFAITDFKTAVIPSNFLTYIYRDCTNRHWLSISSATLQTDVPFRFRSELKIRKYFYTFQSRPWFLFSTCSFLKAYAITINNTDIMFSDVKFNCQQDEDGLFRHMSNCTVTCQNSAQPNLDRVQCSCYRRTWVFPPNIYACFQNSVRMMLSVLNYRFT